jgi:hypothetical protein
MARHAWTGPHPGNPVSRPAAADGGWDDTSWNPTAEFLAGEYRPRSLCPRCGSDRAVDYGAQLGCGRCGASWQPDVEVLRDARPGPDRTAR